MISAPYEYSPLFSYQKTGSKVLKWILLPMQISSLFTEVDFVAVFINNRVNFQSYVASFKLLDQFFLVVLSNWLLDGNCTLKKCVTETSFAFVKRSFPCWAYSVIVVFERVENYRNRDCWPSDHNIRIHKMFWTNLVDWFLSEYIS